MLLGNRIKSNLLISGLFYWIPKQLDVYDDKISCMNPARNLIDKTCSSVVRRNVLDHSNSIAVPLTMRNA